MPMLSYCFCPKSAAPLAYSLHSGHAAPRHIGYEYAGKGYWIGRTEPHDTSQVYAEPDMCYCRRKEQLFDVQSPKNDQ